MEPYYYRQMDRARQSAYHAMKTGLTALSPTFSVPRLESHVLSDVFFQLRLDHPEIFYATGFSYRYYDNASTIELSPTYLFDKGKIREHQKALSARAAKLVRPAQELDELGREQYVHDFICRSVRYDKLKKPYSHEIIGPLGQGVGVCEGIAKSVKLLCDALGLWCVIAVSEAAPEQGVKYRHAWNILRLEGRYYHLDATFDNSLGLDGLIRYDYFNLDDRQLFRDHQRPLYPLPACSDGARAYYREKKLSFTKPEEAARRAAQAARKGQDLVFHWRGGCLTREVLMQLMTLMEEEARRRDRHVRLSVNWPQAVVQVSFSREIPGAALVSQEANAGEQSDGAGEPGGGEV